MTEPIAFHGPAEVVLDVDIDGGGVFLVLHNLGGTVAHDVTVAFKPELVGVDKQVISELPLWKRLRTLRPGKEIRVFWNTTHSLLGARRDAQRFTAVVSWRVDRKRVAPRTYDHDIGAFVGLPDVIR